MNKIKVSWHNFTMVPSWNDTITRWYHRVVVPSWVVSSWMVPSWVYHHTVISSTMVPSCGDIIHDGTTTRWYRRGWYHLRWHHPRWYHRVVVSLWILSFSLPSLPDTPSPSLPPPTPTSIIISTTRGNSNKKVIFKEVPGGSTRVASLWRWVQGPISRLLGARK